MLEEGPAMPPVTDLHVMSRAEFQRRRDALVGFARDAVMVFLVIILVLGPGVFAFTPSLVSRHFIVVLPVLALAGAMLLLLVFLANQTRLRALGLACPACGTPMVKLLYDRGIYTSVFLSGGRCTRCKQPLVEDRATAGIPVAPGQLAGRTPDSSQQFVQVRDRLQRGTRRQYVFTIFCVALATAAAWLASRSLFASGASLLAVTGPWLLSFALIVVVLIVSARSWGNRARALGLVCRECGILLVGGGGDAVGHAVLQLGTCPHCGASVWRHNTSSADRSSLPSP
ncbi:MAG: hypothetical protein DMD54_02140 [Gemmatimonadetes bacterium]|nr:MAG: hypothetical protein DMD54_02140 [Gemmatimonadota bacterium]